MMRKEFIHTRRDVRVMGYVLAMPMVILLLFGFALRLKVDTLTVAVCDQDHTFFSLEVKDRLRQRAGLIVEEVDSEGTIRDHLRLGRAQLGLVIPAGFSRRLADNEPTTFLLFVDGSMPTVAQAGLYGATVLTSEEVTDALFVDDPEHPAPPVRKSPIKVKDVVLFNPDLRDSDFFLPGTIGLVIMLVSLTLAAGFVREKENQTIEQLYATPLPRLTLIAGKLLPYALIVTLDFVLVAVLARLIFGLPFRGSLIAVASLGVLFIVAMLCLGSLLATLAENQLQATFMSVFVQTTSLLLSGFIFPRAAMPAWAQPLTRAFPMTYFVDGIRALLLKGAPATEVLGDYVALGVFVVGFGGLSVARFRKQST